MPKKWDQKVFSDVQKRQSEQGTCTFLLAGKKKNFACLNAGKVALRTYTVVKSMNAPELYMNASVVNSLCCLSREAKKMLIQCAKAAQISLETDFLFQITQMETRMHI